MNRHAIHVAAAMIVCGAMGGEAVAQSEHARKIAESFAGTEYDRYAKDLLVGKPDYVVFTPKLKREIVGDKYNDHFQVFDKPDGTMFAVWTQATKEADVDQHVCFSKSKDKGLTWSRPIVLAGSANNVNPQLLASWQQPMVSKSGRIYVLWNQQTTSRGPHCGQMFGKYSDNDGATWSGPKMVPMKRMDKDPADPTIPPSWCNWQRPLRLGEGGKYLVGVSRHGRTASETRDNCTVEFLQFDNIDDNPEVQNIKLSWFASNDQVLRVEHEKFGSACEEAGIVKLPDGRLFALTRTCAGHPFWSQSRDCGRTWSKPKPLLDRDGGKPYLHPRSPCPIYDWKGCEAGSGYYFAFVHNTFDFNGKNEYQKRGPLYLIAGTFQKDAEQPVWFAPMKLFIDRKNGNSFYTSMTIVDGKCVLWFNDMKFFLLGRTIDDSWFAGAPEMRK
jgi:hypothetical protein